MGYHQDSNNRILSDEYCTEVQKYEGKMRLDKYEKTEL